MYICCVCLFLSSLLDAQLCNPQNLLMIYDTFISSIAHLAKFRGEVVIIPLLIKRSKMFIFMDFRFYCWIMRHFETKMSIVMTNRWISRSASSSRNRSSEKQVRFSNRSCEALFGEREGAILAKMPSVIWYIFLLIMKINPLNLFSYRHRK